MRDMTVGSAQGHLWKYALPVLLGNWLQLAYNAVDSVIAGRFIGKEALAAEGIAAPVMNLVILAVSGLCIGAGVLMSEYFGAGKWQKLRQSMATMLLFGAGASGILMVICVGLAPYLLQAMDVPPEIFEMTVVYLKITFLGLPFTFFYNALSAGLKSIGDSKTPLKFLAFSAVLNAVLDLVFLGVFRFGIVCSAVTTVVAEGCSAVLAAGYLTVKTKVLCPTRQQWQIKREMLWKILSYGGPTALQQAAQPIGKVLIQGQVNGLGVTAIAAFQTVTKVDDFACIPEQGIAAAISTYVAQNRGAGKQDRINKGFFAGLRLEACYWLMIGTVTFFFRKTIVSLFIAGAEADEVVRLGSRYLLYMSVFYLWPAFTNGFQGFFRGMGKMYTTICGTLIQITVRTACTYVLAPAGGIVGIAFACFIGWSAMLVFEVPYYFRVSRQMCQ